MHTALKVFPVPPAPLAVSPSKLRAFSCPYRYAQLYVEGADEGDGVEFLLLGHLAHETVAAYLRHLNSTGQLTHQMELEKLAWTAWRNRPNGITEGAHDDFASFVAEMKHFALAEGEKILGVEVALSFDESWARTSWESDSVAYGGKIDFITQPVKGRLHVRDWTTAALGGTHQVKKDLQLRFYGLLAFKRTNIADVTVTTKSLRTGAEVSLELTREDHEATEKRVIAERERIREKLDDPEASWPAIPGQECGICTLACPYDKLDAPPVRLLDEEQARKAHEQLILIERGRKRLTDLLKSYVGVHGALETNGVLAEYRSQDRISYPLGDLYDTLIASGYSHADVLAALSVDKKRLAKLIKGNDGMRENVDELREVRHGQRFYATASVRPGAAESESHAADEEE